MLSLINITLGIDYGKEIMLFYAISTWKQDTKCEKAILFYFSFFNYFMYVPLIFFNYWQVFNSTFSESQHLIIT